MMMALDMDKELQKLTGKQDLVDVLRKILDETDEPKVIVTIVEDMEDYRYQVQVLTLGLSTSYESFGILDVAKRHLSEEDY